MFNFEIKQPSILISDAQFNKAFPKKEIGIFNTKRLYHQDTAQLSQVKTAQYLRFTANKQASSYYGAMNEADSLADVWSYTPLANSFAKWVQEFPQLTYEQPATALQNAYLDMARAVGRGNKNRYQHNLYAIGTGQTLSAITQRALSS